MDQILAQVEVRVPGPMREKEITIPEFYLALNVSSVLAGHRYYFWSEYSRSMALIFSTRRR